MFPLIYGIKNAYSAYYVENPTLFVGFLCLLAIGFFRSGGHWIKAGYFLVALAFFDCYRFGIIHFINSSTLVSIIIGLLLLDLIGAYLPHLVQHKVKLLWHIHIVHHTDHKVDTTTANRHHPLESVVRFIFTFIGIFVSGAPIGLVLLYQSISVLASQFNHANIQISNRLDNILSYVIVSPNMHKVHHHFELPYTDSNYGNIFSIWDRIFGTYMELDKSKIKYGVDTDLDEKLNSKFISLLERPFKKWYKYFS